MKKLNFKKLAILGVVTGTAMTGQVTAAGSVVSGTYLAAACGGSGNGGGSQGCASNSTTSTVTGPGPAEYYNAPNKGCGAGNSVNGQQSTQQQPVQQRQMQPGQMPQQQVQPQYQASCGGAAGRGYNPNYRGNVAYNGNMPQGQMQPQMGCSAGAQPQGQYYQAQPQQQGQYYQQNGQPQNYQQNQNWNNGSQSNAQQGYVAEANPTMQRNGVMTEKDLMMHLNDQGKAMYQSLDASGKARALKLAGEMTDKNQAVKMAASEMSAKRANATAPK